jgi:NAD(P)-dependent dehydrogenase (short-subunit alcohol dehydrogenase family)
MTERHLVGASALVTGATSGIGRAIAAALAEEGAKVLVVGRSPDRTAAVRDALGAGHHAVAGDLADVTFLATLASEAGRFGNGRLSVLVLCAGHHEPASVEETTAESFDAAIATNLRAPFLLTAALLPALRAARGHVVLVNTSVVNHPRADVAAYAASKAGLRTFADCLRAEVGNDGIRVLSVYPGRTATPMQRDRYEREGLEYHPERLMQPEDVAEAVLGALRSRTEITDLHLRPPMKG